MHKSTKRYVITTNAVNAFGFRVLTSGIDLSLYNNNPVMLWMHTRAQGGSKNEVLPIGNVREIEVDHEGVMSGRLYFDDKDPFAVSLYEKYENGTLNMLSVGTQPIDVSDDPENMLPGQTGPTVMKSLMKEISCVDIGANVEAYAVALYDANDQLITLSDLNLKDLIPQTQQTDMKLITLSAPAVAGILAMLKLADSATEAETTAAIQNLVTLADSQKVALEALKTEKESSQQIATDLKSQLDDQVKLANTAKIETLVQGAVDARKITADQKSHFVTLAEGNFESVEKVFAAMAAAPTIQSTLADKGNGAAADEVAELIKLSWDELFNNGSLAKLHAGNPEAYKAKFVEKFGKEPKN